MKKIIEKHNRVKFGMILIAIGVVYGDIGTSPMYVMKSVIAGNGGITNINRDFILGALSLVIWTITLLTTVKYVLIAMKADNHGEGGIFSLFSLVRKQGRWLVWPAMIGGAALLADGVLTPAVTVTTAIEGIRSIPAMDLFLGEGHDKITVITLVDPEGGHQCDRKDFRTGDDDMVSLSCSGGDIQDGRTSLYPSGAESGMGCPYPAQSL